MGASLGCCNPLNEERDYNKLSNLNIYDHDFEADGDWY